MRILSALALALAGALVLSGCATTKTSKASKAEEVVYDPVPGPSQRVASLQYPLPETPEDLLKPATEPKVEPAPEPKAAPKPKAEPKPKAKAKPAPAPTSQQAEKKVPKKTKSKPESKPAPTADEPVVTPETGTTGKVMTYNDAGRFVVLNFPVGRLPALEQQLFVYRNNLKVGEVKITGPQRDDNIVADLTTGEAQVGDEVRDK